MSCMRAFVESIIICILVQSPFSSAFLSLSRVTFICDSSRKGYESKSFTQVRCHSGVAGYFWLKNRSPTSKTVSIFSVNDRLICPSSFYLVNPTCREIICLSGSMAPSTDSMTIENAEVLLMSFDKEQQLIAKAQGEGMGGGTSAARYTTKLRQIIPTRVK